MKRLKVRYCEVNLADVVKYYVDGFKERGREVVKHDWFCDVGKGKVLLRLYVEEEDDEA